MAFGEHALAFMAGLDGDDQHNDVVRLLGNISGSLAAQTKQMAAVLCTDDPLETTLRDFMKLNRQVSLIVDGIGIHAGVICAVGYGIVTLQHRAGHTSVFRVSAVQGVCEVVKEEKE